MNQLITTFPVPHIALSVQVYRATETGEFLTRAHGCPESQFDTIEAAVDHALVMVANLTPERFHH